MDAERLLLALGQPEPQPARVSRQLDPIDPATAPYAPNTAKVTRLYLAPRFQPIRVATQLPSNLGDAGTLPLIQCRATGAGSDGAVATLTDDMIDVDVYAATEDLGFAIAGQLRYDLTLNAPGVTLDRSTIRRVLLIAPPAVRPYINTGLVRVGATYAVSLHTRSH